jgi:hypothetical protein
LPTTTAAFAGMFVLINDIGLEGKEKHWYRNSLNIMKALPT